jgi:tetratricopeptide (TPR) repeat protein
MLKSKIAITLICALAGVASAQRPNQGEDESAAFVEEGRSALRKGKLEDAAKLLDQALALNPRRVEAYVLRSAVYAARKQYKEGIALMRRAEVLAPGDPEILTALGTHLVLSGDVTTGVPLLQQVVAKEPSRYDAQLLLGHHWHDTGRWPESIAAFEAYFAARPAALVGEDARHRIDLADSYLRYRQPQKALALFEESRTAKAKGSSASVLRARMGIAWATAAIDCKKARPLLRDLEPAAEQHPEIWLVDGQCALALGDASGALGLGRKYLERSPQQTAAGHALVGEAYAARGLLAEAKKELEAARTLEPQRRRWTVRLASVLRRAGQQAEALGWHRLPQRRAAHHAPHGGLPRRARVLRLGRSDRVAGPQDEDRRRRPRRHRHRLHRRQLAAEDPRGRARPPHHARYADSVVFWRREIVA